MSPTNQTTNVSAFDFATAVDDNKVKNPKASNNKQNFQIQLHHLSRQDSYKSGWVSKKSFPDPYDREPQSAMLKTNESLFQNSLANKPTRANHELQLIKDSLHPTYMQQSRPDTSNYHSQVPSRENSSHDKKKKAATSLNLQIGKNQTQSEINSPMVSPMIKNTASFNPIQFTIQHGGIGEKSLQSKAYNYNAKDYQKQNEEKEQIDQFSFKDTTSEVNKGNNYNNQLTTQSTTISKGSQHDQMFNYMQQKEIFSQFQNSQSLASLAISNQNSQESNDFLQPAPLMNKYQKEYSLLYQTNQSPLMRNFKNGLDKVEEKDEFYGLQQKPSFGKLPLPNNNNTYKTIESRGNSFHKKTLLNSGANILSSPINKSQIFSSILNQQQQNAQQRENYEYSNDLSSLNDQIINRAVRRYNI